MNLAKKALTKNNLLILSGGLILTLVLLSPQRQSLTCPQGKTQDPIIGGSCSQFVDQNDDGLCDLLQGVSFQPKGLDLSHSREFLAFIILLMGAIFLNLKRPESFSTLRLGWLTLSLFYFGLVLNQALCPIATLQMIPVLKDKLVLTLFIFLVFLVPILATLLWGKIFCQFLCPLGASQELIFRIPRQFLKLPVFTKIPQLLFYLPYLVLALTFLASAYFSTAIFCRLDPFGVLFGCNPTPWKIIALGAFFLLSLFIFRPFCYLLCPLGAIFKFLSQFQILKKEKAKQ